MPSRGWGGGRGEREGRVKETILLASDASSLVVTHPRVAFFWGFLDHEVLSNSQLLGAFIILIGVYLSAKK